MHSRAGQGVPGGLSDEDTVAVNRGADQPPEEVTIIDISTDR